MEENLHFKQSRLSYINSQKQKLRQKKEQIRLVKVCIGVGMLSKTANEFYVSSTINIYSYFSFTFSAVPKKVELLKKWCAILKIVPAIQKSWINLLIDVAPQSLAECIRGIRPGEFWV